MSLYLPKLASLGFPGGSFCQCRRHGFDPWVGKIPCRREWPPAHCSCLENPMDRGAWQAAVHGVAKESVSQRLHNNSKAGYRCHSGRLAQVFVLFPFHSSRKWGLDSDPDTGGHIPPFHLSAPGLRGLLLEKEHRETVSRGSMRSFFSISSLSAPSPLFYFLLTRMKVNVNSKQ